MKFNYSNNEIKKIEMKVSQDGEYLMYRTRGQGFFHRMKRWSKFDLSDGLDILYGGLSVTFKKHSSNNLKQMDKLRVMEEMTWSKKEMMERRHSLRVTGERKTLDIV